MTEGSTISRLGVFFALAIVAVFAWLHVSQTGVSTMPLADRCQPEEIPPISQPGIIPEEDNPVCQIMDTVIYPALMCDPPTTLIGCVTNEIGPCGIASDNCRQVTQYGEVA